LSTRKGDEADRQHITTKTEKSEGPTTERANKPTVTERRAVSSKTALKTVKASNGGGKKP